MTEHRKLVTLVGWSSQISATEREAEVQGKDILGAGTSTSGTALQRVVRVERHQDHPLARVVLSSEEGLKRILEHHIVEINGIKLEREIEKQTSDPPAFLVLWKGGSAGR